jgi:hypothetical protein
MDLRHRGSDHRQSMDKCGAYMAGKTGVSQAARLLPVTAGFVVICAAIVAIRGDGFERVCGTAMAIGSALMLGGYLMSRFGSDDRWRD